MWRKILRAMALALLMLAFPVVTAAIGISHATDDVYPPRLGLDPPEAAAPEAAVPRGPVAIDPDRPTVAIVLGEEGANVADVLAPYEAFAAARRFNVLTVAPSDRPVTLTGGLDLVPDMSFAQLRNALTGPPEVIVVPQIHGETSPVVDWLRSQRAAGAPLLMSVCVGAGLLAEADLLDDRQATSNWLGLIGLRRDHPEVEWTDGVRFVDDGDLITTAGVLSGIDGSLRVIERLAGPQVANRVADNLHWPGYRPGAPVTIPDLDPAPGDLVALLSASYRWDRPTTGVLLTDGVGEIELASAFRPYTELSYLASLRAVSLDGGPVRSQHGLVFLPRSDWASAEPEVDRLLTLGDTPPHLAGGTSVPVESLHRAGEFPFDGALRDIAIAYDAATARWVARSLQYPLRDDGQLPDDSAAWPWDLTFRAVALVALGLAVALFGARLAAMTRRGRTGPNSETAAPARPHDVPSHPHPTSTEGR